MNIYQYYAQFKLIQDQLKKRLVDYAFSIEDLCEILEKNLFYIFDSENFNLFDLEFNVEYDIQSSWDYNDFSVSGEYISFEEWRKRSDIEELISITIHNNNDIIFMSEANFNFLMHEIKHTLLHELIHVKQSRARNGKTYDTENLEYYDEPDEIEAYAFNSAMNIFEFGFDFKDYILNDPDEVLNKYKQRKTYNKFIKQVNKHYMKLKEYYGTAS